jgi:pyrophosphatase PpaX
VRFPVLLFDLDGTLIDSGAMILASFRHATLTVLEREATEDELLAVVGRGLREEMLALGGDRADELIRAYREHNEPLHRELKSFGGVLNAVRDLRTEGRRLGIVTSKRRATIDLAFAVLPLEGLFDVVVAAEDTARLKPDPEPLRLALDRLGAERSTAAYVGDSPFDVAAANAAGVFSVAVTWGGIFPRERVEAERPAAVVDTVEQLLGVL